MSQMVDIVSTKGPETKGFGDPTGMVVWGGGCGDDGVRVQCSSCLGQQRFARLIGAWQQPAVAGWLRDRATSCSQLLVLNMQVMLE